MPEQSVSYLRDSSGYIVDHTGKIRFAENNFSDTLYEDTSNLVLFHGYAAMWAKDSTVTVPCGSFITRSVRMSVVPTRNNDPYPTRYSYDIYGKNIGRIKFHTFFYASNKHFETRLVRGKVVIWGTGTPKREFLYVDDMAAASVFVMELDKAIYDSQTQPMQSHINVGFGTDVTINELAHAVATATGYEGVISFDSSKPDGSPRKWMDSSKLNKLGWKTQIPLGEGLYKTYQDFLDHGNVIHIKSLD